MREEHRKSVVPFLLKHLNSNPVSFHMPGHKGSRLFRETGYSEFLNSLMECDITEIPGADNLFKAEDVILETMCRYRQLYDTKASYLLINGSSSGLIASIMSTVSKGGKMIMARNCHKSIYNGLTLAEGSPVYVYPEVIEEYGISGEITVEAVKEVISANPDAQACIIPSPNYYGICSDIAAIAEAVHEAGMVLIVDQAHGAHLKFFDRYRAYGEKDEKLMAAENLGADIVINSTHKTLASFTQTAIANVCSDRVDLHTFEQNLQIIQSTSPSYVLMGSLDLNAMLLESHGETLIREWRENIDWFRQAAYQMIPGLKIMDHPMLDDTKINLDMSAYGIDGLELEEKLIEQGIYIELAAGDIAMCLTGIGNTREDYRRLAEGLLKISSVLELKAGRARKDYPRMGRTALKQVSIPKSKEYVLLEESCGRVCAAPIVPYPPGIPVVCPGEVINEKILSYIMGLRARGVSVMGVDSDGCIAVGAL